MKQFNEYVEDGYEVVESRGSDYKLYHKSYTDAVNHALDHHSKSGLKASDDDRMDKIGLMSKKPSEGKTTSVNLPATHEKTGKKHMIHMQVYNKGGSHPYELNTYSSTHRDMQKEAYTPAQAQALENGKKAARSGKLYSSNPHKSGTPESIAWSIGHNNARSYAMQKRVKKPTPVKEEMGVAGGAVAGIGIENPNKEGQAEPGVSKAAQKKWRKSQGVVRRNANVN